MEKVKFNSFSLDKEEKKKIKLVKKVLKIKGTFLEKNPSSVFSLLNTALEKIFLDEKNLFKIHTFGLTRRWLNEMYRRLTFHHYPNFSLEEG